MFTFGTEAVMLSNFWIITNHIIQSNINSLRQ